MPRTDKKASMRRGADISAAGLVGIRIPSLGLPSTNGETVDLGRLPARCILVLHPLALTREQSPPAGWMRIPGAAGCTAQLLSFKASHESFLAKNITIFGVSTQSSLVQRAVAENLALPFPLLSDSLRTLCRALRLPMLHAGRAPGMPRIILALRDLHIEQAFFPTVEPAHSATEVLSRLATRPL